MTTFLDYSIKEKNIKFIVKKYKNYWYEIDTEKDLKFASRELNQMVIWIIGLSGAGKTTFANILKSKLKKKSIKLFILMVMQ